MSKLKHILNNNEGQVVVEYIFLLIVVITLCLTAFGVIKSRLGTDVADCAQGSLNPVCVLSKIVPDDGSRPFSRFYLKKF